MFFPVFQFFLFLLLGFFLYYINTNFKSRLILFVNLLVLSESLFLILFFYGYTFFLYPLLISLICIYYLFKYNHQSSEYLFDSKVSSYFRLGGFFIIILTFMLEFFVFDGALSNNSLISLLFAASLILHGSNFLDEWLKTFFVVFTSFLFVFFPATTFFSKTLSSNDTGFINDSDLIELILVKPVLIILEIIQLNSWNVDNRIFFEDLELNKVSSVQIAESCSGIYSIVFYLSAFFSIYVLEVKRKSIIDLFFLFFGLIFAYVANIFRMAILVLIGHLYGIDRLLWAHENIGWLIFLLWTSLFWYLYFMTMKDQSFRNYHK
tara:strand:+ start:5330 stop:6292 length:963 start_codon:yes stop_codon:yes gene_type:complete